MDLKLGIGLALFVILSIIIIYFIMRRYYRDRDYDYTEPARAASSPLEEIKEENERLRREIADLLDRNEIERKPRQIAISKPNWYDTLQEELSKLQIGHIVFNPPDTMKVGVKDRIEVRVSKQGKLDLVKALKGRGVPECEEIRISERMKVRLTGDDFTINPLNSEEQVIGPSDYTEWSWDVTPEKSGKKVLHLHVTLRLRLDYGEERKDHPVLDRDIHVTVNTAYSTKKFLITYWKWIITALILPLIGVAWEFYLQPMLSH